MFQIFGMNMWMHEPDVMDALSGVIISLVCSSAEYFCFPLLNSIVKSLLILVWVIF